MWTFFNVVRWLITVAALWWLCSVVFEDGTTAEGAVFGLLLFDQVVFWPLLLLWGLPWLLRRRFARSKRQSIF